MFHRQFGAINAPAGDGRHRAGELVLQFSTAFTANLVTNTWLGFPFMMVVTLGAPQAIPRDLEEAASIDGANGVAALPSRHLAHAQARAAPGGHLGQHLDLQHVQHHLPGECRGARWWDRDPHQRGLSLGIHPRAPLRLRVRVRGPHLRRAGAVFQDDRSPGSRGESHDAPSLPVHRSRPMRFWCSPPSRCSIPCSGSSRWP